jgi:hypothetical protein
MKGPFAAVHESGSGRFCCRSRLSFPSEDFVYDAERDAYACPAGKTLTTTGNVNADNGIRYIASVPVCRACPLKPNCCPNMPSRRIVRDVSLSASASSGHYSL